MKWLNSYLPKPKMTVSNQIMIAPITFNHFNPRSISTPSKSPTKRGYACLTLILTSALQTIHLTSNLPTRHQWMLASPHEDVFSNTFNPSVSLEAHIYKPVYQVITQSPAIYFAWRNFLPWYQRKLPYLCWHLILQASACSGWVTIPSRSSHYHFWRNGTSTTPIYQILENLCSSSITFPDT